MSLRFALIVVISLLACMSVTLFTLFVTHVTPETGQKASWARDWAFLPMQRDERVVREAPVAPVKREEKKLLKTTKGVLPGEAGEKETTKMTKMTKMTKTTKTTLSTTTLHDRFHASMHRMKYWDRVGRRPVVRGRLWPELRDNRYLVFQTWRGGFNNERMSLELAVAFAIMTGRTLVLPPMFDVYLLAPSHLGDYFDLDDLKKVVPVLMFEEWLDIVKIPRPKNEVIPPEDHLHPIWGTIRAHPDIFQWEETNPTDRYCWIYPRMPTDPVVEQQMRDWCLSGFQIIDLANNATLSAPHSLFIPGRKLFDHYFTHMWFEGSPRMADMLNGIRNYVHYVPKVVEVAARIVAELPMGYNALHARRGDFQYEEIRELPPASIMANTANKLPFDEPLYLATDNFTQGFTDPWKKAYRSFFTLGDFKHILTKHEVPKIWMGLLDQLVLTQAKTFVGTRLSTFSAFAVRMRGFMGASNVETYFTTDNLTETAASEREHGLEGHRDDSVLPTWRREWHWATWGRDFKEPFEFCGYDCLKRGQVMATWRGDEDHHK